MLIYYKFRDYISKSELASYIASSLVNRHIHMYILYIYTYMVNMRICILSFHLRHVLQNYEGLKVAAKIYTKQQSRRKKAFIF